MLPGLRPICAYRSIWSGEQCGTRLRGNERAHDFDFALADGFDELVAAFARAQRGKVIPWDVDQKRIVFRQGNERVTVDFSRMQQPDILM